MRRPRVIAEQARHAAGPLGRLIAFIMARETWSANRQAIEALQVRPGHNVIDIGCGHGRSLALLCERGAGGRVVGIDPSPLMVEIARRRNRRLVRTGQCKVVAASAEALPFTGAAFDRALCVHVVYFWPDLHAGFSEIARVLKPGGRLALLFRTKDDPATQAFPPDIYRFTSAAEMSAALEAAGFGIEAEAPLSPDGPVLIIASRP